MGQQAFPFKLKLQHAAVLSPWRAFFHASDQVTGSAGFQSSRTDLLGMLLAVPH